MRSAFASLRAKSGRAGVGILTSFEGWRGRGSGGTGGAIVMQSDPEEEYEEILLKAEAPMRAIMLCAAEKGEVPGVASVRG